MPPLVVHLLLFELVGHFRVFLLVELIDFEPLVFELFALLLDDFGAIGWRIVDVKLEFVECVQVV